MVYHNNESTAPEEGTCRMSTSNRRSHYYDALRPTAISDRNKRKQNLFHKYSSDDRDIIASRTIQPIQQRWERKVPNVAITAIRRTKSDLPPSLLIAPEKIHVEAESRDDMDDYEKREDERCPTRTSPDDLRECNYSNVGEEMRTSLTYNAPPRRSVSWSEHVSVYPPASPSTSPSPRTQEDSHERLYTYHTYRSKQKQNEGKERRKAINQISKEKQWIPSSEYFGKISQSRAGDMYDRGNSYLFAKQLKLHNQRKNKKESSDHHPRPNEVTTMQTDGRTLTHLYHLSSDDRVPIKCTDNGKVDISTKNHGGEGNHTKISQSRAGDVYNRGISYLHKKQKRIWFKKKEQMSRDHHACSHHSKKKKNTTQNTTSTYSSGEFKLSYQRMPESSIKRTLASSTTITSRIHTEHPSKNRNKKIPTSKAGDMYERGLMYLQSKQSRLEQLKKTKREGKDHTSMSPHPNSTTISIPKATALYDRGMNFLEAKAMKLEEKRRYNLGRHEEEKETVPSSVVMITTRPFSSSSKDSVNTSTTADIADSNSKNQSSRSTCSFGDEEMEIEMGSMDIDIDMDMEVVNGILGDFDISHSNSDDDDDDDSESNDISLLYSDSSSWNVRVVYSVKTLDAATTTCSTATTRNASRDEHEKFTRKSLGAICDSKCEGEDQLGRRFNNDSDGHYSATGASASASASASDNDDLPLNQHITAYPTMTTHTHTEDDSIPFNKRWFCISSEKEMGMGICMCANDSNWMPIPMKC